ATNLVRTMDNLRYILKQNNFVVRKNTSDDDRACVVATRDGREYTFDLEQVGDGCKVRVEINQSGNDGDAWQLLRDVEMMP
ncbi:MAG: hypothetical protein ACRDD1_07035, partial [Planctomycetia bacterium]